MFDAIKTTEIKTDADTFRSRGLVPKPLTTEVMLTSSRSPVVSVFVNDVVAERTRCGNAFACVPLGFSYALFATCKHGVMGIQKEQIHVLNNAGEHLELRCDPIPDPRKEVDLAFLVARYKRRPWFVPLGTDLPPTPEFAAETFTVNVSGSNVIPVQTIKQHDELCEVQATLFCHYDRGVMTLIPHEHQAHIKRFRAKRLAQYRLFVMACETGDSGSPVLGPHRSMFGMVTHRLENLLACLPNSEIVRGVERVRPLIKRAVPELQI